MYVELLEIGSRILKMYYFLLSSSTATGAWPLLHIATCIDRGWIIDRIWSLLASIVGKWCYRGSLKQVLFLTGVFFLVLIFIHRVIERVLGNKWTFAYEFINLIVLYLKVIFAIGQNYAWNCVFLVFFVVRMALLIPNILIHIC